MQHSTLDLYLSKVQRNSIHDQFPFQTQQGLASSTSRATEDYQQKSVGYSDQQSSSNLYYDTGQPSTSNNPPHLTNNAQQGHAQSSSFLPPTGNAGFPLNGGQHQNWPSSTSKIQNNGYADESWHSGGLGEHQSLQQHNSSYHADGNHLYANSEGHVNKFDDFSHPQEAVVAPSVAPRGSQNRSSISSNNIDNNFSYLVDPTTKHEHYWLPNSSGTSDAVNTYHHSPHDWHTLRHSLAATHLFR